jgi:type III pantothenate kinase
VNSSNTILFDIGNTRISYGISNDGIITEIDSVKTTDSLNNLEGLFNKYQPVRVIASSVVPDASNVLYKLSLKHEVSYYECGKNLEIPVKNLYQDPSEVGQDRLLNVYAVNTLYKNKNICLVIDIGTALTFDFITRKGEYNGGLIFPGIQLSLENLLQKCARLPENLVLKKADDIYAKNTQESINNGIVYGYSFLIKGLISHLKEKEGDFKTLIAGGGASFLVKEICEIDFNHDNLAIYGLNELVKSINL